MARRALVLLALALPLAAVEVRTDVEEGILRVRIEGDRPPGASWVGSVYRVLGASREVFLAERRMAVQEGGVAEGAFRLGEELAVAGTYRVRVRAEDGTGPGSESRFEVGAGSTAFLRMVRDQEAFLTRAFGGVGDFLDRLNALEKEHREAPDAAARAGVRERWGAWRGAALKPIGEIVSKGQREGRRCFPLTWDAFAHLYVQDTLVQMESRKLIAAELGVVAAAPHSAKGSFTLTRADLEPLVAGFHKEAAQYRLEALNALYLSFKSGKGSRDRWEPVLELAEPGPEGFPAQKELTALAASMRALWEGTGTEDQLRAAFQALQEKAVPP